MGSLWKRLWKKFWVPAGAIRCKRVITQMTGWINVRGHAYERMSVGKWFDTWVWHRETGTADQTGVILTSNLLNIKAVFRFDTGFVVFGIGTSLTEFIESKHSFQLSTVLLFWVRIHKTDQPQILKCRNFFKEWRRLIITVVWSFHFSAEIADFITRYGW